MDLMIYKNNNATFYKSLVVNLISSLLFNYNIIQCFRGKAPLLNNFGCLSADFLSLYSTKTIRPICMKFYTDFTLEPKSTLF